MIDTQHHIKLSIIHEQSLQHGQKQCCEVSVPLPQSLVFSIEQLSVETTADDNESKTSSAGSL